VVSFLRFPHQNPVYTSPLIHTRYMLHPCHSSRFYHPDNIGRVQIIQLLITKKKKKNLDGNITVTVLVINPLNPALNPICYSLALLAHHFLHVSRIMVKSLPLRLLTSYIYGAHILDVSRSHTTTHHSR